MKEQFEKTDKAFLTDADLEQVAGGRDRLDIASEYEAQMKKIKEEFQSVAPLSEHPQFQHPQIR